MYYTNILQYLEQTASSYPEKIAFSDGTDEKSFNTLLCESQAIGSFLLSKRQTKKPILVLMNKHPDAISAFMGAIYAGCYYVAIDAEMPEIRIKLIIESLDPEVLIYDEKNAKKADRLPDGINKYLFSDIKNAPIDSIALDAVRRTQIDTDPIYIVFTSGSTGIPKGVSACHRSVIDYTETLCEAVGFNADTVFGNQTPLYFDAPLKEIMPTLKFGATTYFIPKQLFMFPTKLCDYLNEHRINTVCWVVSALTMISSLGALVTNPPKHLKTVCFGSEVFPIPQYKLWRDACPNTEFFNLYGPTEATGMSTFWHAERELDEGEVIPIGNPFRNTQILLLDEKGSEVPFGEVGEIYIRGTCVTLGYFNNKEKTDEAFVQNPLNKSYPELIYKTGDLAKYNSHGELVFVSRRDSQIKHMGHRIELGEIEAALANCFGVQRACCVYNNEQKKIYAFYVGTVDATALMKELKTLLPRYMIPNVTEKLDTMPLTPNGKIDRKLLKEKTLL